MLQAQTFEIHWKNKGFGSFFDFWRFGTWSCFLIDVWSIFSSKMSRILKKKRENSMQNLSWNSKVQFWRFLDIFWGFWWGRKRFLNVWTSSAERGRPAKGRGKLKLSPLDIWRIQVLVSHAFDIPQRGMRRIETATRRPPHPCRITDRHGEIGRVRLELGFLRN